MERIAKVSPSSGSGASSAGNNSRNKLIDVSPARGGLLYGAPSPSLTRRLMRTLFVGGLDPLCRRLPRSVGTSLLEKWTAGLELALCLHRVGDEARPSDPQPVQTIPARTLDELLEMTATARRSGVGPARLTVTFDDGYRDAVEYVASRAPRHPDVDWVVSICPEKLVLRSGFRWDLWEEDPATRPLPLCLEAMQRGVHPLYENRRPELLGLADKADYALATVEECRALLHIPNVRLANHTSSHLSFGKVNESLARLEIARSMREFEELFGKCEHFAFPFGVPGRDFHSTHEQAVREAAPGAVLWSSRQRPFAPDERGGETALPRIAAPGSWSPNTTAVWLALLGRRELARGSSSALHRARPE